jgi:hypothetical protein
MNNCETGTVVHTASMFILSFCACLVFVLSSFVLSFVSFSGDLNEEVLTLFCFFLVVRMDIS